MPLVSQRPDGKPCGPVVFDVKVSAGRASGTYRGGPWKAPLSSRPSNDLRSVYFSRAHLLVAQAWRRVLAGAVLSGRNRNRFHALDTRLWGCEFCDQSA